ncbi:hypothetical protein [Nostoc sp. 'Lobaria pulmonaria (5183) cyanobiont']|uniref:hypothetical protein n=1 Tax=Nostoc sp. 'Lobaria pulmonaria (5183) cyanobiont' TaxID=1618022 RepID=UPI00131A3440|nr:hypothetical protein [Nostoc sp. 'Lobaria pulmonaria (5183) cyanobiont']
MLKATGVYIQLRDGLKISLGNIRMCDRFQTDYPEGKVGGVEYHFHFSGEHQDRYHFSGNYQEQVRPQKNGAMGIPAEGSVLTNLNGKIPRNRNTNEP